VEANCCPPGLFLFRFSIYGLLMNEKMPSKQGLSKEIGPSDGKRTIARTPGEKDSRLSEFSRPARTNPDNLKISHAGTGFADRLKIPVHRSPASCHVQFRPYAALTRAENCISIYGRCLDNPLIQKSFVLHNSSYRQEPLGRAQDTS